MNINAGTNKALLAISLVTLGGLAMAEPVDPTRKTGLNLQIETSVNGGPWKTVPTDSMRALEDGRIWLPYQDQHVRYRLQTRRENKAKSALSILDRGDLVDEGAYLTLHSTQDLKGWRPLDVNAFEVSTSGLAVPSAGSGFWKLDFNEQIPDPTPLPPLQIEPDPSAIFPAEPIPSIPGPGNGNPSYFGEFSELPTPIYFPGEHAFNKYIFEERVHQHFEGDVKGFAVALANEDGTQMKISGGWARDPQEDVGGGLRMTTFRPGNVGSVGKLFSGVALMQLLEALGPDIDTALNLEIGPYLPNRWSEGTNFKAVHESITFEQLLNHTSGLGNASTSSAPLSIQDNPSYYHFTINPVGNGYQNENYRIMTYLIPRLADPAGMQAIENQWADADFDTYLDEMMLAYGLAFEDYMKNSFFPQIANCAPSADPANDYTPGTTALMYEGSADTAGLQWSQKEESGFARGQGGYWCTAMELARFMQSTRYTNDLLSPAASDLLITGNQTVITNDWSNHAGFGAELGEDTYWCKPGLHASNTQPLGTGRGLAMFFPYDWVCSAVINSASDTLDNESAVSFDTLLDGFYDATRNQPVTISKEAMTLATFDEVAAYLRLHNMEVKWLDLYDIGGVPYVNAIFGDVPEPIAGQVGLNTNQYEEFLEEWVEQKGFAIQQVESYLDHGKIRYAAIITEEDRPEQRTYHGYGFAQHVAQAEAWEEEGFVPVNVSVVSLNGIRRYTALYEARNVSFRMLSRMNAFEYDSEFDNQGNLGRKVVSLNAYRHAGEIQYAAIWHTSNAITTGIHHADRDAYRAADAAQLNAGDEPSIVTGVDAGVLAGPTWARHRFGATWR